MPKRTDNNQKRLVEQIRGIPGTSVLHLHEVGRGCGDLLVGYQNKNYFLEVKDPSQPPSKRKLTEDEQKFHANWKGQISIVETIEDVFKLLL